MDGIVGASRKNRTQINNDWIGRVHISDTPVALNLVGRRVALREVRETDFPVLWSYIYGTENPEWKQWDAPYFPLDFLSFEEYAERQRNRLAGAQHPLHQAVITVEERVIGIVTFYWENQDTRWLEMGIVIYDPACWSGGYGTEALALWSDYLFEQLPIARVGLTTWSGNHRMIRAAEKLGMMMEGRMRKCRYYDGEYYDSIRMGILREEWEAHRVNYFLETR